MTIKNNQDNYGNVISDIFMNEEKDDQFEK